MPLPSDPETLKTSQDLVAQLQTLFGKHPGYRPAHAKGILLTGTFTPSSTASTLSSAPHFHAPSTPISVRFSNSTGIPVIPDFVADANPRGIAVRFHLPPGADGHRKHTDIIAHSTPFFPVRTGAEFLAFLQAAGSSGPDAAHPTPIEQFLGGHPSALAFVTAPKPTPSSYAREEYFGVNAFKLVDSAGKGTFVRYRIHPALGVDTLDDAALAGKSPDFLQEEIAGRLKGDGSVTFHLRAQVAEKDDVTDDATVHWPDSRKVVELGTVKIERVVETDKATEEMKNMIFDPIPRVQGVESSGDPLLEMRASVYLVSGRERRAA